MSLLEKLCNKLDKISFHCDGVIGIAFKDFISGEQFYVNGDEVFPVASTIKVTILMEFFRKVEDRKIDPYTPVTFRKRDNTIGSGVLKTLTIESVTMPLIDYATLMITVSDNSATNMLIDLLGMESINSTIISLGLQKTRLARKMMDMEAFKAGKDSITTPKELIMLFESLYRPLFLSPYIRAETLKMLKKPKEGIVQGVIRNAVPDEVEVANKSGWIAGATLDAGIVFQPRRPYVVALAAKHIPSADLHMAKTISTLTNCSRLIHEYFTEVSLSTPQGKKIPRE